jgi:hypothetical protein
MSTMSRAFIGALGLGMAMAADRYEWKGIFYTPDKTYKWGAQKKDGAYADPSMKIALIPTSGATAEALASASTAGNTALGLSCQDVTKGGTLTPMEGKCYRLVFDQSNTETKFTVDASSAASIAFFAEHFPTEFEATDHYFKDTTGADIEPVAQAPDAGGPHSHAHGVGKCVCQAKKGGWKLNCADKAKVQQSVTNLKANAACKAPKPPQSPCVDNYYVMQTHHDHCLHDDLPIGIEKDLHDYEQFYDDCFIKRQYNKKLSACPAVDCTSQAAMTQAIATLQSGCAGAACAKSPGCQAAIKVVLMAHDICKESQLPNNLEKALHDYEDACEDYLCNSASAPFDPYAETCPAPAPAPAPTPAPTATPKPATQETSGGFGTQDSLLVATSALPLAVAFFL